MGSSKRPDAPSHALRRRRNALPVPRACRSPLCLSPSGHPTEPHQPTDRAEPGHHPHPPAHGGTPPPPPHYQLPYFSTLDSWVWANPCLSTVGGRLACRAVDVPTSLTSFVLTRSLSLPCPRGYVGTSSVCLLYVSSLVVLCVTPPPHGVRNGVGVLQVGLRVTLSRPGYLVCMGTSGSDLTVPDTPVSDAPLGSIAPSDASDPLHRGW